MILTASAIKKEIKKGRIKIDPFNEDNIGPNSYDLTLSNEVIVYKHHPVNPSRVLDKSSTVPINVNADRLTSYYRDIKDSHDFYKYIIPDDGIVLVPGVLYLMRTAEYTATDHFVPMLEGRSSVARHGIFVHATAGFGDIGFSGMWTLEVSVIEPVKIYAGMRICQIYWITVEGKIEQTYQGKYQDGLVTMPSRIYEDFKK